jgi:hypothetical protein
MNADGADLRGSEQKMAHNIASKTIDPQMSQMITDKNPMSLTAFICVICG